MRKIVCDPLKSPRVLVIIVSLSCNLFFDFVPFSCVDIVEIFLCEGGDVEQWLEPRNISLYLCLIYSLSLSHILHFYILFIFIYILDIVCVLTLVFNQESN